MSLRSRSSAASSLEKSIAREAAAPQLVAALRASSGTAAGRQRYGDRSGVPVNDRIIGSAAASNWDIGSSPRISSIVRSIELVEYRLESTAPRRAHGLTTSATVRWASM